LKDRHYWYAFYNNLLLYAFFYGSAQDIGVGRAMRKRDSTFSEKF